MSDGSIDIHQHLWPVELIDALRRRTEPPFLRDWTLHTSTEPAYDVRPGDHDPGARRSLDAERSQIVLSMSTPLGIEDLPADEAQPLLDAWHEGLRHLERPFTGWAAVSGRNPDLDGLDALLRDHAIVGLQISATWMSDPARLEALAPVLRVCERADRPVFVHPGPVDATSDAPAWWPAVVGYPSQLHAAWWAWHVEGRKVLPDLRICFAAGAGLAPAHHERFATRSGERVLIDPRVFVDSSALGRQGTDAALRALGIDALVLGSDRPYATPQDPQLGAAAWHAISVTNPLHLLEGVRP